ncbi:MAG: hypothetical protein U9N45_07765 [Gemmatimonadota bacterium]|nr:hypothetical protein [Gemmatimonadota bacterium]
MERLTSRRLIVAVLLGAAIIFLQGPPLWACEIEVKARGGRKEASGGEVVILEVHVFLTHKDCPEGIKATKFKTEGMEVLGATKWKQTALERFVRLVKVKMAQTGKDEAVFHARRTCDKEENGGYGFLKLKVSSVEIASGE